MELLGPLEFGYHWPVLQEGFQGSVCRIANVVSHCAEVTVPVEVVILEGNPLPPVIMLYLHLGVESYVVGFVDTGISRFHSESRITTKGFSAHPSVRRRCTFPFSKNAHSSTPYEVVSTCMLTLLFLATGCLIA